MQQNENISNNFLKTKESGLKLTFPQKREGIEWNIEKNKGFFPSHFLSLIIGKPGYGKTSLLKTMLKEDALLFKKFDHVLILSPSIVEYTDLFLPNDNTTSELNFSWIIDKITHFGTLSKEYINVLLILDDFVSEIKDSEFSPILKKILYNRRHLLDNGMVSIIITTQKYRSIPTIVRAIINHIIFYRLNPLEEEAIEEEQFHSIDRSNSYQSFKKITNFVFNSETSPEKNKHAFLLYNIADFKFFKNFDEIIFI